MLNMSKSFFSKVREVIVTAFKRVVAFLFPQWCIKNKTLKSNLDAWNWMPSLSAQAKAVAMMSEDELAQRFWSSETLQKIFHERNIFWFEMTEMEFYNLLGNRESVEKAICHPKAKFTVVQIKILISRMGLYALATMQLRGLTEFISSELNADTGYAMKQLPAISVISSYKSLYQQWLVKHRESVPEDAIVNMIDYLFSHQISASANYNKEKLSEMVHLWETVGLDNHALWLSMALRDMYKKSVCACVVQHFDNILYYVRQNRVWKQEFLIALAQSNCCSFDQCQKIYDLCTESSDKMIVLATMVGKANHLGNISTCFKYLADYSDEFKANYHKYLISRALDHLEKVSGRFVARETTSSYLKIFFNYSGWTEAQKEIALRAMAAGQSLKDEDFEDLNDDEKAIVINELEIFSELDLLRKSPSKVIEHKIHLLPEAEAEFFVDGMMSCYKFWNMYVEMFKLSQYAYAKIVRSGRWEYYIDVITLHASRHGLTEWEYRQLMNSPMQSLAPQLKQYLS